MANTHRLTMRLRLLLVGMSAAALLISLAGNVVCAAQVAKFYRQLNALRLDPLGLAQHAAEPVPARPQGEQRVVLFGDSRALMWEFPRVGGFQVINRGVSHQTTAQLRLRAESTLALLRPDVLVLELGINDLKAIPLFPADERKIVHDTVENIRAIVALALTVDAEVVICSVFPLGGVELLRRPFWSERVAVAVAEVNAALAELTTDRVHFLDLGPLLLGADGALHKDYAADLLHLSPAAYRAINTHSLVPLLRRLR